MGTGSVDDRLIQIVSHLTVPEADLARNRLAMDGISAYLGNATFVLWCWHLSNADGGVTLHVRTSDVDAAGRILSPSQSGFDDPARAWNCAECGERSQQDGEVCWRCGTSSDGTVDQDFHRDSLPEESSGHDPSGMLTGWASLSTGALYLTMGNAPTVLIAWVAILLLIFLMHGAETDASEGSRIVDPSGAEPDPVLDAPSQSLARRRRMGEAIARRAYRASMFAFFMFPPLALYSLYLLWRLNRRKTPLGPSATVRYFVAWSVTAAVVLLWVLLLAPLLGIPTDVIDFLSRFLDFSGTNLTGT